MLIPLNYWPKVKPYFAKAAVLASASDIPLYLFAVYSPWRFVTASGDIILLEAGVVELAGLSKSRILFNPPTPPASDSSPVGAEYE
tara:strand:- start:66 stop:323 length:258 start_codon:yes stop_codon:yes gene_type:complete